MPPHGKACNMQVNYETKLPTSMAQWLELGTKSCGNKRRESSAASHSHTHTPMAVSSHARFRPDHWVSVGASNPLRLFSTGLCYHSYIFLSFISSMIHPLLPFSGITFVLVPSFPFIHNGFIHPLMWCREQWLMMKNDFLTGKTWTWDRENNLESRWHHACRNMADSMADG